MKLAVLSDIHANLPALDAVLRHVPSPDAFLCCGDLVGYYPDANEVCDRLRSIGAHVIRGNHDAYVTGQLEPDPVKSPLYRTEWTREHLQKKHLAWLRALPAELRFDWDSLRITMRHASPWDEETYLYEDSPALGAVKTGAGDLLILGHTHRPMLKRTPDCSVLNPGSVGQPRDWDPRASYATVDTKSGEVGLHRVVYDFPALQRRLRALAWERETIDILGREKVL